MTFFNPADKNNKRLFNFCQQNIQIQKEKEIKFKTIPDEILIHGADKNYKIVSNVYYMYHMGENEYDTETELIDEDQYNEEQEIKLKYANKNHEPYRRASLKYKNKNIDLVRQNNKLCQQKKRAFEKAIKELYKINIIN